jgi:hypothetical protein
MAKMMAGKNSAPGVLYRFTRLTEIIGTKKIRDLTRQDSIAAALDTIGEGRRDGRTAKQFAGEVLTLAKRLWRFAKAREWVQYREWKSCRRAILTQGRKNGK